MCLFRAIKLFERQKKKSFGIRNAQCSIALSVHKQPSVFNTTYTIESRVNCVSILVKSLIKNIYRHRFKLATRHFRKLFKPLIWCQTEYGFDIYFKPTNFLTLAADYHRKTKMNGPFIYLFVH